MSSETSFPDLITSWTSSASGVPSVFISRNISPVDTCGIPFRTCKSLAWVPLPAPGAPIRTIILFIDSRKGEEEKRRTLEHSPFLLFPFSKLCSASAKLRTSAEEAFVVPHNERRLDLCDRVHRHSDDDQEAGTAEVELISEVGRDPVQSRRRAHKIIYRSADKRQSRDLKAA